MSINGANAGQLIKAMMPRIPADGYGTAHRNKRLADNFPQNLWLYFGQQEQFTIKTKDSIGKVTTVQVAGNAVTVHEKHRGVIPGHALINTVNDILNSYDRQWKYAAKLSMESNK